MEIQDCFQTATCPGGGRGRALSTWTLSSRDRGLSFRLDSFESLGGVRGGVLGNILSLSKSVISCLWPSIWLCLYLLWLRIDEAGLSALSLPPRLRLRLRLLLFGLGGGDGRLLSLPLLPCPVLELSPTSSRTGSVKPASFCRSRLGLRTVLIDLSGALSSLLLRSSLLLTACFSAFAITLSVGLRTKSPLSPS